MPEQTPKEKVAAVQTMAELLLVEAELTRKEHKKTLREINNKRAELSGTQS